MGKLTGFKEFDREPQRRRPVAERVHDWHEVYIPWTEDESRERFELAMRLIEPGQPTQSRLLMHPLHPDGGGDYAHNGVRRWMSQDDAEWQMLAAWVRGERTGADCQR